MDFSCKTSSSMAGIHGHSTILSLGGPFLFYVAFLSLVDQLSLEKRLTLNWILLLLGCKLFRDRNGKGSPGSDYGDTHTPLCFSWGPLCDWYQQHGWFHNMTEIRCGGEEQMSFLDQFLIFLVWLSSSWGTRYCHATSLNGFFLCVMCCSQDQWHCL